jgi:hypothetical protein
VIATEAETVIETAVATEMMVVIETETVTETEAKTMSATGGIEHGAPPTGVAPSVIPMSTMRRTALTCSQENRLRGGLGVITMDLQLTAFLSHLNSPWQEQGLCLPLSPRPFLGEAILLGLLRW